jgi:hypothetical protein
MERKCQIEKLPRSHPKINRALVVARESNPALKGDQLPQIDDGQLPCETIKLPARRDRLLAGCKQIG